jgi:D-3-phosphoglycerate dehydrogenase / 2-oxoglutarate reductase
MMRVPVTDYTFPTLEPEQAVLSKIGATIEGHQCNTEDEVIAAVGDARVILAQFAPITRRVLEHLGKGAAVVRYGVGVDNIDLKAAKEVGVKIAYVPDYCLDEVADHTTALLLALLRQLPILDRAVREGRWDGIQIAKPMLPLNQVIVGFIGFGRMGQAVLTRLKAFRCTFLIYDPFLQADKANDLGVSVTDLDTVLKSADAITLHAPLNEQTRHLINAQRLVLMKPSAVLVNTARGGLIDPVALSNALNMGQLRAAGLDVFEKEPLPQDSPLRAARNLLLTPHLAWYSETAIERLQRLAAEEVARFLQGQALRCPFPI